MPYASWFILSHWGLVTHICVGKRTIIGSHNGLSPGLRQAIIRTNAGILLIWPLGTKLSEILIAIETFSFEKMHLKMSGKCGPFWLGLNMLIWQGKKPSNLIWFGWQDICALNILLLPFSNACLLIAIPPKCVLKGVNSIKLVLVYFSLTDIHRMILNIYILFDPINYILSL